MYPCFTSVERGTVSLGYNKNEFAALLEFGRRAFKVLIRLFMDEEKVIF